MSDLALPAVRGQLLRGENLAPYTWFRVGGPADVLFIPADEADLADFLKVLAPDVPVTVLGVGSNVIVRDGGIGGVVVRLAGRAWAQIVPLGAARIRVGAGALDSMLAKAAAKAGVAGLEFFVGVPGTVGGALTMNAGCYGRETKDVLVEATALDRNGQRKTLSNADFGFTYRHNALPDGLIFLDATFEGEADDPATVTARMEEITARREAAQPIREKTGGSTFKNPALASGEKLSAWQCVDAAGMRGARRGGAQVSEKHANFLINTGEATAADIEGLGEDVRATVKAKGGVELQWEIKRIGRIARREFSLFADYFQFYLEDEAAAGIGGDGWTPEAADRMLAVGPGVIAVGTARNMNVPVVVEILDAEPLDDLHLWEHVTECSIEVSSGALVVMGCTDYRPDAARLSVTPGTYRARISAKGLGTVSANKLEGEDIYRVQLWRGDPIAPRILRQRN